MSNSTCPMRNGTMGEGVLVDDTYRSPVQSHRSDLVMMARIHGLLLSISTLGVAACATAGSSASIGASPVGSITAPGPRVKPEPAEADEGGSVTCADAGCGAIPMPVEITRAIETRIEALRERGCDCSRYGAVLESSYRSGRITIRPFMWRVGKNLTSGEAKPNGDMTLAREFDSLNVGFRTVDDVLWSMEHEAVHITFDLASGIDAT